MRARDIIKKEYGDDKNFMTPHVLSYGKLPPVDKAIERAYELSEGTGFEHEPIFGVSIVNLFEDGTTARDWDISKMCRSKQEAEQYIQSLKNQTWFHGGRNRFQWQRQPKHRD
jgi:hypothetical protein